MANLVESLGISMTDASGKARSMSDVWLDLMTAMERQVAVLGPAGEGAFSAPVNLI